MKKILFLLFVLVSVSAYSQKHERMYTVDKNGNLDYYDPITSIELRCGGYTADVVSKKNKTAQLHAAQQYGGNSVTIKDYAVYRYCTIREASVATPKKYKNLRYKIIGLNDEAFRNEQLAATVRLPQYLKYMGECCFEFCGYLKKIVLPEYLERIGGGSFGNCTSLKGNLVLPPHLKYVGETAFMYTGIDTLTINSDSLRIAKNAFYAGNNVMIINSQYPPVFEDNRMSDPNFMSREQFTIVIPKGTRYKYASWTRPNLTFIEK